MRPNKLRQIWADGGAVVNGWLGIPSTISAETSRTVVSTERTRKARNEAEAT